VILGSGGFPASIEWTTPETPELESLLSVVEQARPSATERPDHERSTVEPFREVVQELVAKGLLRAAGRAGG
jgi:hypothetical protein